MARVRVVVGPSGHAVHVYDSPASSPAAAYLRLAAVVCGCDTDLQRTAPFCSMGGDYSDSYCKVG